MAVTAEIVERAARRAEARAGLFGGSGEWSNSALDLVASAARRWPERTAIADRWDELTYTGLDRAVDHAAAGLAAAGVQPGDAVLLVVQNDVASVISIHAGLRAGAVVLVAPISAGLSQLADIVTHTEPVVAVAPASAIGSDLLPESRDWISSTLLGEYNDSSDPPVDGRPADAPSVVIFTSGTTSRPKGVIHSLDTLMSASRNYVAAAALGADDRLFVVSPLASITGMLQCVTVPCHLGASVVLETDWSPSATCDLLLERGGTFFGGPDLLLDRLLDEVEARGGSNTSLGAVYLGGTMLDPRILERVETQFGIVVLRAYGSSEAPISTAGRRSETREQRLADDGSPLEGVEVRRGSQIDPNECCLTGPHLFLGYVDPEDDAHAFETDGEGRDWFCTGDIARLDGGRVKIVGRIRDIVIRKGMKVPISEVEEYVNQLPGIARCAGYAIVDAVTGERLAIAVMSEPGAEIDFESVVEGLRAKGLATWKLPEEIVLWDEPFPENATGKVLRTQLEAAGCGRPRLQALRLREPK